MTIPEGPPRLLDVRDRSGERLLLRVAEVRHVDSVHVLGDKVVGAGVFESAIQRRNGNVGDAASFMSLSLPARGMCRPQ